MKRNYPFTAPIGSTERGKTTNKLYYTVSEKEAQPGSRVYV